MLRAPFGTRTVSSVDHPLLPLTGWFFDLPYIVCPACSRGHLEKTTAFVTQRSGLSYQAEAEAPDGFEPELGAGVFTGILTCSLTGRRERVAVAGDFEDWSASRPESMRGPSRPKRTPSGTGCGSRTRRR